MASKPDLPKDSQRSCKNDIPNNEVIEELSKDLDSFLIKDSGTTTAADDTETITSNDFGNDMNCEHAHNSDNSTQANEHTTEIDGNDFVDEEALKDVEVTYTDEDKQKLRSEAEEYKMHGNDEFKAGNYRESALNYTQALRICPLAYAKDRAIMYSNRAAAKMKLVLKPGAIEDCTKAIELDSSYLKALYRRAQLYEETDKLDEALADYQAILVLDPLHREALYATKRLPEMIQERNEKLKADMLGKLKDLGNMILRPFNLSTDNFQLTQDPSSGGYSVSFQQANR